MGKKISRLIHFMKNMQMKPVFIPSEGTPIQHRHKWLLEVATFNISIKSNLILRMCFGGVIMIHILNPR